MHLPRLHLFALEDQPWFPDLLLRGLTDYVAAIAARTRPCAPVLATLFAAVSGTPAPLTAWRDGVVSCCRTYHPDELQALATRAVPSGMHWTAGEWWTAGQPLPVTCLLGTPTGAQA